VSEFAFLQNGHVGYRYIRAANVIQTNISDDPDHLDVLPLGIRADVNALADSVSDRKQLLSKPLAQNHNARRLSLSCQVKALPSAG